MLGNVISAALTEGISQAREKKKGSEGNMQYTITKHCFCLLLKIATGSHMPPLKQFLVQSLLLLHVTQRIPVLCGSGFVPLFWPSLRVLLCGPTSPFVPNLYEKHVSL